MPVIFETVVRDGSRKVWKILNLTTNCLYAQDFETEEEASNAIEYGKMRSGMVVWRISLEEIRKTLEDTALNEIIIQAFKEGGR